MDEQRTDEDKVSGIVDTIIFSNEENSYTVFVIEDMSGESVTVTGTVPFLAVGDKITVHGTWQNHATYGLQFKCENYEKELPHEEGDILRYLSSGAVKGIGPRTAQRLVDKYGTDVFDVIENHPDWLTDISGITQKRAQKIKEGYDSVAGSMQVMMFCQNYFTPQTARKIYEKWGGGAVDKIKSNPYRLCEDFWGISFQRADQIAAEIGYSSESEERVMHGAVYILKNAQAAGGHTCMKRDELIYRTSELLFGNDNDTAVPGGIASAVARGKLRSVEKDGETYIAEPFMYDSEIYIADKLRLVANLSINMNQEDAVRLIRKCEGESGIEFAEMQRSALYTALSEGVMILTGGPGTGKTTIIKGLLSIFDSLGMKIALAAPTGRAAKRMSEATSHTAKTVHRLLEMDASDESGARFARDADNTLEENVIIIDEASMLDVPLTAALLRAMKNGSRLILIGDADQLPSVGAGNVLGDLIASGEFPVVRLTEIFRQSEESLIIVNAHRINRGELPQSGGRDADFFIMNRFGESEITDTVIDLVSSRLPKTYGEDIINRIQVITPSRKGSSGTVSLNVLLQAKLNPASPEKAEVKSRDRKFRVGDRVMQTKNDYSVEWTTDSGKKGTGIYNGDIGIIEDIDDSDGIVNIRFDDRECELDASSLDDIDHAYAVTVHKSQGSEYPIVIMPLYSCAPALLTRNLLYTAVTRASRMVILVGRRDILAEMTSNNRQTMRNTLLYGLLKEE